MSHPSSPSLSWESIRGTLPQLGLPGSRATALHVDDDPKVPANPLSRARFLLLQWIGTVGALLIGLGGLGAGALPVVDNPYDNAPLGSLMARMLQTSSALVFIGVALMVAAWIFMAKPVGALNARSSVSVTALTLTFIAWTLPLVFTAPMFTQDIYSYLAQGSIVAQGMDPYSAGPVSLLGTEHHLARSVPFIWAESPSPYGPVALAIAAAISVITNDSIVWGVFAHRIASLLGLGAASWALVHLARRCHVEAAAAMWLGILNPLTILHLVGGIHNESLLLGFMLVGMEYGLRGADRLQLGRNWSGSALLAAGAIAITCGGLVKVTGFIALGFIGMAAARALHLRGWHPATAILTMAAFLSAILITFSVAISAVTGVGLGWVTGQGGAASIGSWMSMTTVVGFIFGFFGMLLEIGDHTSSILTITRSVGLVLAAAFIVRMLFATFAGRIHPVGGLGVGTFVMVILFPVVHPWYLLWAIVPLAAWANRRFFQVAVIIYSAVTCFFVLPRGLSLPPETVVEIYLLAIFGGLLVFGLLWFFLRKMRWIP